MLLRGVKWYPLLLQRTVGGGIGDFPRPLGQPPINTLTCGLYSDSVVSIVGLAGLGSFARKYRFCNTNSRVRPHQAL